ncbi:peptidoglycan-binding domain-containing protein [Streptomyces sp. MP131-18]|uniref:peptidoglycan-binding domain-containing protein n=1 Tax=Streptomyces sp. MP131-18 TaxID=1857892 RepID=UPI00097C7487|nr:peptidoglycan-binding domain-containing protein [Streptomyces sp. MP131-18]ONK09823.1 putative peptidoglycan binding domain protein [Streptomyces sp. MP131-18]
MPLRTGLALSLATALTGVTLALAPGAAAEDVAAQAGTCTTWKEYYVQSDIYLRQPVNGATGSRNCTMGVGSQGPAVRQLQLAISRCYSMPIAADGEYGPDTEAAVEFVQRNEGATVDGDYGPETRRAMEWPNHRSPEGGWTGLCSEGY